MRRGRVPALIFGEDGKIAALFLSADFCAEHGIDRIKRARRG